jgi:hypothetical protein
LDAAREESMGGELCGVEGGTLLFKCGEGGLPEGAAGAPGDERVVAFGEGGEMGQEEFEAQLNAVCVDEAPARAGVVL